MFCNTRFYQPNNKKARYDNYDVDPSSNKNGDINLELIGMTPGYSTWLGRRKLRRTISKEHQSLTPFDIEKIVTEKIIQTTPKLTARNKFIMTIVDKVVQFEFESSMDLQKSTDFLHFADSFLLKMLS